MKLRRYRLNVWATVDIDAETGEPTWSKREIERHINLVLQKAEPDCDCEVMDFEDIEQREEL